MGFPESAAVDRLRCQEPRRRAMAHVGGHLSFETLADLEQTVIERCCVLNSDQLKPGTKRPLVAQAKRAGLISRRSYEKPRLDAA